MEHPFMRIKTKVMKNSAKENKTEDLFDNYKNLPKEVIDIITKFDYLNTNYNICSKLVEQLNVVGYTCEYGLDAIPYNLQKIID